MHGTREFHLAGAGDDVAGTPIEFSTSGHVLDGDRRAVVEMLDKLPLPEDERPTAVSVRLVFDEHDRVMPATARVTFGLPGGAVRATIGAATMRAAIDLLEDRLRGQLRHRGERRLARAHRGVSSGDGEWRHGDLAAERPTYFPRPVDEREVVRHKSVAPAASTIEEAAFDLTMMDYDFYLFVHLGTGRDALVHRSVDDGPDALAVVVDGGADGVDDVPDGVALDARAVPALTLDAATEVLDVGHEPWVFFRDVDSSRGHVLYRRYDGHYGLLVPIDEPETGSD